LENRYYNRKRKKNKNKPSVASRGVLKLEKNSGGYWLEFRENPGDKIF